MACDRYCDLIESVLRYLSRCRAAAVAAFWIALFLAGGPLWAQPTTWTAIGPSGGAFRSLGIDSSGHVYASEATGDLYLSIDTGRTWTKSASRALQFELGARGEIYQVRDKRLWVSHDSGDRFDSCRVPLLLQDVGDVVVGSDRDVFVLERGGPGEGECWLVTRDAGATWSRITLPSRSAEPRFSLSNAGVAPDGAFLVRDDDNVLYRFGRDSVWERVDSARIVGAFTRVGSQGLMAFSSVNGDTVQVLTSGDAGRTWIRRASEPLAFSSGRIANDAGVVIVVRTGFLWRSEDTGTTWQQVPNVSAVHGLIALGDSVFISNNYRGFVRTSFGMSGFTDASEGLPNQPVRQLVVARGVLLGVSTSGLIRHRLKWERLPAAPGSLTLSPGGTVIAALDDRIISSSDAGLQWSTPSSATPRRIDFLTADSARIYVELQEGATYSTSDLGSTWDLMDTDFVERVTAFSWTPFGVMAGTQAGLYRYDATALRWRQLDPHLRSGAVVSDISAIGRRLIISTRDDGLRISDDGGLSWDSLMALPSADRLWCIRDVGIFARTPQGLALSSDRGASWRAVQVPDSAVVMQVVSVNGGNLAFATSNGVYLAAFPVSAVEGRDDPFRFVEHGVRFSELRCFPNPAHDQVSFELDDAPPGVISASLVDALGRVVLVRDFSVVDVAGGFRGAVNLDGIAPAFYMLRVGGAGFDRAACVLVR